VLSESKPILARIKKKMQAIWNGTYVTVKVNDNGTVCLRRGTDAETIKIKN
jgi:hypothetical protein